MMFDIAMYYPDQQFVTDPIAETVDPAPRHVGTRKRWIVQVLCEGVALADAYTHEPDPEDEQLLLDLVRVRGVK